MSYAVRNHRILRLKQTSNGPVEVSLSNFVAKVLEELVLDNGIEQTRAYVIEGRLDTGEPLPAVRVPAGQFGSMAWVAEKWGVRAVVSAGYASRDHLREAIQSLSPRAGRRRIFTHTGWRELNDEWVYLSANGAVGRDDIEVDLDAGLERYRLPREPHDPIPAMRASLRLLNVAPVTVTIPLWSGAFRAPLANVLPIDVSIWLEGMTGSLKTTLAGLFLAHFGAFTRLHLPGEWTSTANQLEHRAFVLKDSLFVIDDYAPRAGVDSRELEAKAARLLRAQGNLAGRGRLRADLSERPVMPPRGLILATGEQHPPGQSILARTLLVQLKGADVRLGLLTQAQRQATLLPHAMAGYVQWLAPQLSELRESLPETLAAYRAHASLEAAHLRVPEAVASLFIGCEYGLLYAKALGVLTERQAAELRDKAWDALLIVGTAQGRVVEEERPTLRFLRRLSTLVTQGRVFILPKQDVSGVAKDHSEFIGWHDDDLLYLIPEAACAAIARFGRDSGDAFPIREERLRRELAEEGFSEHDEGRLLKTIRLGTTTRKLLCLRLGRVADALSEPFPVVATVTSHGQ